jgi:hypothetical protein
MVGSALVSKKGTGTSKAKGRRRAAAAQPAEALIVEVQGRASLDDLLRWSEHTRYVAKDLVLKYHLLLDDRHVRQVWLDHLELDAEARAVAKSLMDALRDAIPWAIRAIEGHLVGPGRSEFSQRMLRETATMIVEAITKESFQMAEARGVPALSDLDYHYRARHEARGYLRLHRFLHGVKLDEGWVLRLAAEVKDRDANKEPWPRVLIRLGDACADVLQHRRLLEAADVAELLALMSRTDEEWARRISHWREHRRKRVSGLAIAKEKKELLIANVGRLARRRWDVTSAQKFLAEAMDLAGELAEMRSLRAHQAWKIAARRVPLKKVSDEEVSESVRRQLIRTSPRKLRAAMDEAARSGSKKPSGSGSKRRT